MKKSKKILLIVLAALVILVVLYCITPLRAAIAENTAKRYVEKNYAQYGLETAELTGEGYTSYRYIDVTTDFMYQSVNEDYLAVVTIKAWLPWCVTGETAAWQQIDGEYIMLEK